MLHRCGVTTARDVLADLIEKADGKISCKVSFLFDELADGQAATVSVWCAADEVCSRQLGSWLLLAGGVCALAPFLHKLGDGNGILVGVGAYVI